METLVPELNRGATCLYLRGRKEQRNSMKGCGINKRYFHNILQPCSTKLHAVPKFTCRLGRVWQRRRRPHWCGGAGGEAAAGVIGGINLTERKSRRSGTGAWIILKAQLVISV